MPRDLNSRALCLARIHRLYLKPNVLENFDFCLSVNVPVPVPVPVPEKGCK